MLQGKGILTAIQRDFLAAFSSLPDQDRFYLTGGTALAEFYLGHRLSFDLDFFTGEPDLVLPFSRRLEGVGRDAGFGVSVTRRFASFVEFLVTSESEELRVDLALDSPFRFEPPVGSPTGVLVNNWVDLAVDKVLAYYGRAEPRDAVDLAFILDREPLDMLMVLAQQKDPGFDAYWLAVALNQAEAYPDDIGRWPVKMLVPLDPVALKQRFAQLAIQVMATAVSPEAPPSDSQ